LVGERWRIALAIVLVGDRDGDELRDGDLRNFRGVVKGEGLEKRWASGKGRGGTGGISLQMRVFDGEYDTVLPDWPE
jgi:hypothetical protein